jgi:hypothetical protein
MRCSPSVASERHSRGRTEGLEGPFETHPPQLLFALVGHDLGAFVAPVSCKPF